MKFEQIQNLVEVAAGDGHFEIDDANSLSAPSLRTLLKSLARELMHSGSAYVEIGVFRGGTLLDVASATSGKCIGIDNFSLFDHEGINENHIRRRLLDEGIHNVELISLDFEVAVQNFGLLFPSQEVGLLMVDGAHDYRSQLLALLGMKRHMAPGAVIVVDDANYGHVRQAGYDFVFANSEWEVTAEILTEAHPDRGSGSKWWNGIQILTRPTEGANRALSGRHPFPADEIQAIQALIERFRETHETFRHRLAPVAAEVLDVVRDAPRVADITSTLENLRTSPSVTARHTTQNVDVNPEQVGVRYRPDAHRIRLELPKSN